MAENSSVAIVLDDVTVDDEARIGAPAAAGDVVFGVVAPVLLAGLAGVNVGIARAATDVPAATSTTRAVTSRSSPSGPSPAARRATGSPRPSPRCVPLLDERDFTASSLLLNALGEGTFLDLLKFIADHAQDGATAAAARLAHRDESRHVHFGISHIRRAIRVDPGLGSALLPRLSAVPPSS
jgi:hypothetical protein